MRKSIRSCLVLVFIVILSLTSVFVFAADAFVVNYDVMPGGGTSSEEILVFVRASHDNPNEPMWIYVFWDSRCIVMRQTDIIVNKIHQNRWDITFYPPKDLCTKGVHRIWIWVEDSENTMVKKPWDYTITNVVPQLEWFDDLSAEALAKITGPQGPVGPRGIQGKTGVAGPKGPEGDEGDRGLEGPEGDVGLKGPEGDKGSRGPTGIQGEVGPEGPQGKLNTLSLVACFVVGFFALIISIVNFIGRKG